MAEVKATLTADIGPLKRGLAEATSAVKAFDQTTASVDQHLKKFGNEFSGARLIARAGDVARKIEEIGGAAKLSDGELRRATRTIDDAITKYARLGQEAPSALRQLQGELRQLQVEGQKAGQAIAGVGTSGGGLSSFLAGMAGGAAALALGAVANSLREIVSEGTRLGPLAQSFERLQGGSANAERALVSLRTATRGLVGDADLMQAANKGSLLGLDAMGIKFDQVAQVATVLGRAMGQDAAKSVDDLTTALSRMSPQILDNLGIKVDLTQATKDYAAALGTTADKLTEEQRKQAFATAAMDAAVAKAKELGEVKLTLAEQGQRVVTMLTDIAAQAVSAGNQSVTAAGKMGQLADTLERIRNIGVGNWWRSSGANSLGQGLTNNLPFQGVGGTMLGTLLGGPGLAGYYMAGGATGSLLQRLFPSITGDATLPTSGSVTGRVTRPIVLRGPTGGGTGAGTGTGSGGARTAAADPALRGLYSVLMESAQDFLKAARVNYDAAVRAATADRALVRASSDNGLRGSALTQALYGSLSLYSPGQGVQMPAGANRLSNSLAGISVDFAAGIPAVRTWATQMRGVVQAFAQLAQIAGPSLDNVTRGFGTVIASADAAQQLTQSLSGAFKGLSDGNGNLSTAGKAFAGGAAGLTTGLQLGGLFTNRGAGFATGAAGGAVSGFMAGGPYGAAAGAIVGGFSGLFAANQNRRAQMQAVEQMRQQTIASFGTVNDFRQAVERAGFSYEYFLQSFNSSNPRTFTDAVNRLNAALAEQKSRSDKLAASLQNVAKVQGVLSRQQLAQIRTLRPGDSATEAVNAFLEGQAQQAETGNLATVEALARYQGNVLQDFGGSVRAAAAGLAALFGEAIARGESAVQILSRLGGAMNTVAGMFSANGGQMPAGFAKLQDLAAIVNGQNTGIAVQTAAGLGSAIAGFQNTGVFAAMPELFGDIANGIGAAWKALENFGAGGARGLAIFQPYLQTLWEILDANPELKAQLDDQTRAALEFAEANGAIGPAFRDSSEKMLTALDRLIAKLDEFIARLGTASGIPLPGVPTAPAPGTGTPGGGNGGSGGDYDVALASGGIVTKPTRALIGEAGPEAVIPLARLRGRSTTTQTITVNLDGRVLARSVAKGLPSTVAVWGAA